MKTAIVFYSKHHGNTKKLLDAIALSNDVELIDVLNTDVTDLSSYDMIGFASGIYFAKFQESVLEYAQKNLPEGKKVFFIFTGGDPRESHNSSIKAITDSKGCEYLGSYFCKGFDTFGPFKLVGGIAKGHPDEAEIAGAVDFYKSLI